MRSWANVRENARTEPIDWYSTTTPAPKHVGWSLGLAPGTCFSRSGTVLYHTRDIVNQQPYSFVFTRDRHGVLWEILHFTGRKP